MSSPGDEGLRPPRNRASAEEPDPRRSRPDERAGTPADGRNSGMVGGLEAGRRVAAAALLAFGILPPLDGPLLSPPPAVVPVADAALACAMTVGTASTDPVLATDAARAVAVGYAT